MRQLFETNVFAPVAMMREFAPLLVAAGNARVVQMSSIASRSAKFLTRFVLCSFSPRLPTPFNGPYNASKAALSALSDTARIEMEPLGIKVIVVSVLVDVGDQC